MPTGDEADINVNLSINTIRFMKDLRQVGYALEHLASTFRTAGFVMTAALTMPIIGLGTAALQTAGQLEQTDVAFTTLLGSAEAAKTQMEWMKKFAATTPFQFEDVAAATRRFLAYGFSIEESNNMMTKLVDATSAMGGSPALIEAVTRAIGQMHAKGKVTAEEMRQLSETGLPVWEMLAKYLKTDVAGAMQLVGEKGKGIKADVGIAALMEGMSDPRFKGAAEKLNNTLLGQYSNLKDKIYFVLGDIGEAISPMAMTIMQKYLFPLLDKIDQLAMKFKELPQHIKSITVAVLAGVAAIGPALLGLSYALQMLGGTISGWTVIRTAMKYGIGTAITGAPATGGLAAAASGASKAVSGGDLALAALGGEGAAKALSNKKIDALVGKEVAEKAGIAWMGKGGAPTGAAIAERAGISWLGKGGGLADEAFGLGLSGVGLGGEAALAGGAGEAAVAGGGAVVGGGMTLGGTLLTGGTILVAVAAVVALAAAFKSAYDQSKDLRDTVKGLIDDLSKTGTDVVKTIFGSTDPKSLMDGLMKGVDDARKAFDDFGASLAPTFTAIVGAVDDLVKLFDDNFPAIWKIICDIAGVVGGVLLWAFDALKPLIDAVANALVQIWNDISDSLGDVVTDLMPTFVDLWGDLQDAIGSFNTYVVPVLKALFDVIVSIGVMMINDLWPKVKFVIDELIDTFKAAFRIILDALGFFLDVFSGDFGGAIDHLADIALTGLGWIKDTVGNFVNLFLDLASSAGDNIYDMYIGIYNSIATFLNGLIEAANKVHYTMDEIDLKLTRSQQKALDWQIAMTKGGLLASEAVQMAPPATGATIPTAGHGKIIEDKYGGLPRYASGGFVGFPQAAIVGDAPGGEYIIPANKMGNGTLNLVIEMDGVTIARKTAPIVANMVRIRQGMV